MTHSRSPRPRYRKRFGQHHLRSPALCAPLIRFLAPEGAPVVEIGPGGGVLTRALLDGGASRVWACEVDQPWAFEVRRRLGDPRLAVAVHDALRWPWHRLPAGTLVAGNLPYNVATPILARVLRHRDHVVRAGFMVQKEVGDRLVATPGDSAYGALSVLVAARAAVRRLAVVAPGSFVPPPKVAGAFVGLTLRPPPLDEDQMPTFDAVVKAAFATRRKTVRNALGRAFGTEQARLMLAEAGVDPGLRAEALGLDDFVRLTRARNTGQAADP